MACYPLLQRRVLEVLLVHGTPAVVDQSIVGSDLEHYPAERTNGTTEAVSADAVTNCALAFIDNLAISLELLFAGSVLSHVFVSIIIMYFRRSKETR